MRNWLKTTLFVSTFSPCLISIALARVWERGLSSDAVYYGLVGLAGMLLVQLIINAVRQYGEEFPFTAKKLEANDAVMLSVIATYFVPFIGRAADITIGAVLLIVVFAYTALWISSSILPSPIMRLFGYRFYKAESTNGVVFTLITKRDLLDPRDVRMVKVISGSMLIEVVK